ELAMVEDHLVLVSGVDALPRGPLFAFSFLLAPGEGVLDRTIGIAVVQKGDVEGLAGIAAVVREHAGGADELLGLSVARELAHGIEDLPYPERQQPAAVLGNRLARKDVGNAVVVVLPLVRVDEVVVLGELEQRLSARTLLVHVGEVIPAFEEAVEALLG